MKKAPKLRIQQIQELSLAVKTAKHTDTIRKAQAILCIDKEVNDELIQEVCGYSRKRAESLRRGYLKEGIASIDSKTRGIRSLLTQVELDEIVQTVKNRKPSDVMHHQSIYWNTSILGRYIEEKYNVRYKSKTSYCLIFKSAKFSFHKPGKVYKGHDEAEVQKWIEENKERIYQSLHDKHTVVLAEDEMILSTQTTFQKIWLELANYPKVEVATSSRKNKSLYGFLNLNTGKEHVFSTDKQNMYETKKMLRKIRKLYPDKHILLLWDNVGWHKGSVAQEYIQQDGNIDQIHFPKYSPELNPQEHVWKQGRHEITHNQTIENIKKTTRKFVMFCNSTFFHYSILGINFI